MYRTYEFNCFDCGHEDILLFRKDEHLPDEIDCPECGEEETFVRKQFYAPRVLKASYHDGYSRGERWALMKEAAKLEADAYYRDDSDSAGMEKEAKKLFKKANTKRDKDDK